MKQHTLTSEFSFEGKGLHTGLHIHARFLPAKENFGIQICRTDLIQKPTHPAIADYVTATERGTVLSKGAWRVSTVEHALSALYAMGIDNCLIEVDAPEIPILDGSAKPFIEAIQRVGVTEQREEQEELIITKRVEYTNPQNHSLIILHPADEFSLKVEIGFPSPVLPSQSADLIDIKDYPTQIAPCRTFCFVREVEMLLGAGLIQGGDLQNALVIYDTEMEQEKMNKVTDALGQPRLDAKKLGYLSPLRFENEPARHKLLDLIGDLSLVGKHIRAHVEAYHPGHTTNTQIARQIRQNLITK